MGDDVKETLDSVGGEVFEFDGTVVLAGVDADSAIGDIVGIFKLGREGTSGTVGASVLSGNKTLSSLLCEDDG